MSSGPVAAGLPSDGAGMVHEVVGIVGAPSSLTERAEALLAQVQRVVRFDAGLLTLLPPGHNVHVSLARSGFEERVCGFLDGPGYLADVERIGLRRSRRPIRVRDLPFPLSELPLWGEYLGPAGFRDGTAVGLFPPQGHYLGGSP